MELDDTLFIRNLSFDTQQDTLKKLFEDNFGETEYCLICKDKATQESKGTAFVRFKDKSNAAKCLEDFKDFEKQTKFHLEGRNLMVLPAMSRDKIQEMKKAASEAQEARETKKDKKAKKRKKRFEREKAKKANKGVMSLGASAGKAKPPTSGKPKSGATPTKSNPAKLKVKPKKKPKLSGAKPTGAKPTGAKPTSAKPKSKNNKRNKR